MDVSIVYINKLIDSKLSETNNKLNKLINILTEFINNIDKLYYFKDNIR